MIRRFNYTSRKRIGQDRVSIRLVPTDGAAPTFEASLRLDDIDLPAEALIHVEAYYKSSYMRFPFGTVGHLEPPADRRLTEIDRGDAVLFRVKVVGEGDAKGRILAELDDLVADAAGTSEADRYCILPVRFGDIGQEVWRVALGTGRPVLEVSRFDGAEDFVRTSPMFLGLVFPSAVREILQYILIVEEHEAADDGTQWQDLWIRFAARFHVEKPPAVEDDRDGDARLSWIAEVVSGFCAALGVRDKFGAARTDEATR